MVGVWRSVGVERRRTAATFAALTFASILLAGGFVFGSLD
jgi:hypothetical protein